MSGSFDGHGYFERLCQVNKLAREHDFKFCRVTGLEGMQEAWNSYQKCTAFFCIDDTTDGSTVCYNGGYYKRRVFTVFLIKRYPFGNMAEQHSQLEICRQLYDQICSRLIRDKEVMQADFIINTERIHFREMEKYFLSGCTGLYFMVDVDEPIQLCYEPQEWEE